jgi:hypothetical protein
MESIVEGLPVLHLVRRTGPGGADGGSAEEGAAAEASWRKPSDMPRALPWIA